MYSKGDLRDQVKECLEEVLGDRDYFREDTVTPYYYTIGKSVSQYRKPNKHISFSAKSTIVSIVLCCIENIHQRYIYYSCTHCLVMEKNIFAGVYWVCICLSSTQI